MPQNPDDPNQRDTPTAMVLAEEPTPELTLRQRISGTISGIFCKLDDSVWQPILRKLAAFQEWERKKIEVSETRQKVKVLLSSDAYQKFDDRVLTLGSIFGPDAAKIAARQIQLNPNAGMLNTCFLGASALFGAGFASDTALNTYAEGSSYWLKVVEDESDDSEDPEKKKRRLEWQPGPVLNLAGIVGVASDFVADEKIDTENMRLARLARIGRIGKVLRSTRSFDTDNSLEDQSVKRILEDFSRRVTILLGSVIGLTVNDPHVNFISMGIATASIYGFIKDVRRDVFEVVTKNLNQVKENYIARVRANPIIQHLAQYYDRSKNEAGQLEDWFYECSTLSSELGNPAKEQLSLDEAGELVPKMVVGACAFVDLRNSSSLHNQYDLAVIPRITECFSQLHELIEKHGQFSNFSGDGAAFYFKDDLDDNGEIELSQQDKAVRFALDLAPFSAKWNKILSEEFPSENELENNHQINFGIFSGPIIVLDVFSKRSRADGTSIKIRKAEIMGNTVNAAQRVESLNKVFPGYIILMPEDDYHKLSPEYQKLCRFCGEADLKGIGGQGETINIWGIPQESDVNYEPDIDALITYEDEEGEA